MKNPGGRAATMPTDNEHGYVPDAYVPRRGTAILVLDLYPAPPPATEGTGRRRGEHLLAVTILEGEFKGRVLYTLELGRLERVR